MLQTQSLASMFKDQTFAWQLLEYEILIETKDEPDGLDISNLLQLYMRGVEVMNTCLDPRQSYFKSKVTALMGKNTVRKTFKPKQEIKQTQNKNQKQQEKTQQVKNQAPKAVPKKKETFVSANTLQQKKKELQLRLAYATQEHSPDGLRKLIAQTKQSQIKITNKIQKIMQSHEQKLNERINKRRLKTATYKSKPEDQMESLRAIEQDSANGNVNVPISNQTSIKAIPETIQESPLKSSQRRQYKSVDAKEDRLKTKENSENKEENDSFELRLRRASMDFFDLVKI